MRPVVYDAAVLIAADRNDRRIWAEHRVRLEAGMVPLVPSLVLAQVSRSAPQAQMRRLLRGCDVTPFGEEEAHAVGRILAASGSHDIADGAVVELAVRRDADIATGDPEDMARLLAAVRAKRVVHRV